ncbi:TM0106 family RecB-like putative nuclease [Allonocardiopsis opalescens]|uniref:AAA+ ATPase domain-containing protein n=1 Tax=Allonocardiopsis opalescens TaxID=1144618 RepID=A0A2T0PTN8_9ACTN|nr:TM0106 family RecB-like putative nuclease [Allonocardiopsis opalescens]PRX92262.1 uncharacterized protein CLV72_11022 [Allonocardiopsis opalescens]
MLRSEAGWVISPTDLVDTLECGHRSRLRAALAADVPGAPRPDPVDQLVLRHGMAHERNELERLRDLHGDGVVEIPRPDADPAALTAAAQHTAQALREGVPVVYQGVFYRPPAGTDPGFFGRADFLIRADLSQPPAPRHAPGAYEPWDTKLARHAAPGAVVQLTAYAQALADAGFPRPERMHLLLGDGATHTLRVADYLPMLRHVRARLTERLCGGDAPVLPAPDWAPPRPACASCAFSGHCATGREQARDLSLVAGIRTDQTRRLADAGITTIDALAAATDDQRPPAMPPRGFARLRAQAAIQVRQDATRTPEDPVGRIAFEVADPAALGALPAPSPGDVFFDMEGDPYALGGAGLEYLFGAITTTPGQGGEPEEVFHTFWAHDRAQEKAAFEAFVDFTTQRLAAHPGAHVYHYAPYEPSALKRLAAAFATREAEVDDLLRERRLVDLYAVVRQSLLVSQRSYSIKYLEPLYLPALRHGEVTTAASSIEAYEEYRSLAASGDTEAAAKALRAIGDYNRDDCVSTRRLLVWLTGLRERHGVAPRPVGLDLEAEALADAARARREEIAAQTASLTGPLVEGVSADPRERDGEEGARALLAALVGYYRRETNPQWWEFFRRRSAPLEELEADADCLVGVRADGSAWAEPEGRRRKWRREVTFRVGGDVPHPFSAGEKVQLLYPGSGGQGGTVVGAEVTAAHPDAVTVVETADADTRSVSLPAAVLPGPPVRAAPKDEALADVAADVVAHLPALPGRAGVDLLARRRPRLRGGPDLPQDPDLVAAVIAATDRLDGSYLAVQGPPGAGKTYLAAQLIGHLVASGRRVGVCATSHKAVENVLVAALAAAKRAGREIPCAKQPARGKPDPLAAWEQPRDAKALARWRQEQPGGYLVGGTAWVFSHLAARTDPVDVLIVDEAGQFALADALAVSAATRDLVLLGDPAQLPQVVQGTHGEGSDASALEHLLDGEDVLDARYGYFLDQSRRMHPAVCAPVSRLSYRGRLHAHPSAAARRLEGVEPGLRPHPVAHRGRTTHSPEEVAAVVARVDELVGRTWHDPGEEAPRPLAAEDVMVVAPYNRQVRALRTALAEAGHPGARVGTVDRFQGQEAPVVLVSMTASSALDLPRGLEFVLSRNRLNVALSRAQVLAEVVYSPGLLTGAPRTVAELRLVSAFTGLVDSAHG